jgi:chromate transporter
LKIDVVGLALAALALLALLRFRMAVIPVILLCALAGLGLRLAGAV